MNNKKFKLFIWNSLSTSPLDFYINQFFEENDIVFHDIKYSTSCTDVGIVKERSALLVYNTKMKFGEPENFTIPD